MPLSALEADLSAVFWSAAVEMEPSATSAQEGTSDAKFLSLPGGSKILVSADLHPQAWMNPNSKSNFDTQNFDEMGVS